MRALPSPLLFVLPLLLACAATPPPKPAEFELPIKTESGADACLATASAKREKRTNEPARITVKHVLVRYQGAKNAPASVTRTREAACLRAREAHAKLEGGADFDAVVKEYSEEDGAASRGGSLGAVERRDVLPTFGDAAFELDAAQVSDVVETDRGFHVILRTE